MRATIPEHPITTTGRDRQYRFERELFPGQVIASVFFRKGQLQAWSLVAVGEELATLADETARAIPPLARIDYVPENESSHCHLTFTKESLWVPGKDDRSVANIIGSIIIEPINISYIER